MELNHANYFTEDNRYLSNSKINDWLRSPEYFYKKHIAGEIEQKTTDSMILGSAIDCALTEGWTTFKKKYTIVNRRNKSADDYKYQLNETMYKSVSSMYDKVREQEVYERLMKHQKQKLLVMDMKIGEHFDGLCGILDFLQIAGDTAKITDLKTTDACDGNQYYWKCINYGYFRQMAMYDLLVRHTYPQIEHVIHRHLTIHKDSDDIYRVQTYMLSEEKVQEEMDNINKIIGAIAQEKDFKNKQVDWADAVRI